MTNILNNFYCNNNITEYYFLKNWENCGLFTHSIEAAILVSLWEKNPPNNESVVHKNLAYFEQAFKLSRANSCTLAAIVRLVNFWWDKNLIIKSTFAYYFVKNEQSGTQKECYCILLFLSQLVLRKINTHSRNQGNLDEFRRSFNFSQLIIASS